MDLCNRRNNDPPRWAWVPAAPCALLLLALAAGCAAPRGPAGWDRAALYGCVARHVDFPARPTLPLVVTVTERSFQNLLERKDVNRHAYAVYVPHYDTVVLSPRADRATLAHEFAHALGVRHAADKPDVARQVERNVRRGEICPVAQIPAATPVPPIPSFSSSSRS